MNTPASRVQPRRLPAMAALLASLLLAPTAFATEPAGSAAAPSASLAAPAAAVDTAPVADGAAPPPSAAPLAATPAPAVQHNLSPLGMFANADAVVKGVMLGLILASVVTWTIWLAKGIELLRARRRLSDELAELKGIRTLDQAAEQARAHHSFSAVLIDDAREELQLSAASVEKDGLKERVSFRLERLVAASGRKMSQGTGVLATIGSTSPFVGLFGTVWGIMNSFIGIAESQTTNLAVVAPGIAEALLATALGLVAAIPAVVIYNVFARGIAGYKAQVADISAQVLLLVSRDLDHQSPAERNAARIAKAG